MRLLPIGGKEGVLEGGFGEASYAKVACYGHHLLLVAWSDDAGTVHQIVESTAAEAELAHALPAKLHSQRLGIDGLIAGFTAIGELLGFA